MQLNLWCTPRSLSTAFEKMVENRRDFLVFGEPYCEFYLKNRENKFNLKSVTSEFKFITEGIMTVGKTRNVFVKEMAHHVTDYIGDDLIGNSVNTFLIRHPQFSVPSLYRILNSYTDEEAGFERQLQLFERVRTLSGAIPVIIDGEVLRSDPAAVVGAYFRKLGFDPMLHALSWKEGSRKDWSGREVWHEQAIHSTGFMPNSTAIDLDMYPLRVRQTIERCTPIYDYMRNFSIHDTHCDAAVTWDQSESGNWPNFKSFARARL